MTISELKEKKVHLPQKLADLLNSQTEIWTNEACYGYCIHAMQNVGYSEDAIQNMIRHLHSAFEELTVAEAEEKFRKW